MFESKSNSIFIWISLFGTIILTVYGQFILKLRINQLPTLPSELIQKLKYILIYVFDPWIFSGFVAAFIASITWMAVLSKMEISVAYPFLSINFLLILFLGGIFLGENFTIQKVLGTFLVILGTYIISKGL